MTGPLSFLRKERVEVKRAGDKTEDLPLIVSNADFGTLCLRILGENIGPVGTSLIVSAGYQLATNHNVSSPVMGFVRNTASGITGGSIDDHKTALFKKSSIGVYNASTIEKEDPVGYCPDGQTLFLDQFTDPKNGELIASFPKGKNTPSMSNKWIF